MQEGKRKRGRPRIYNTTEKVVNGICDGLSGDVNYGNDHIFEFIHDSPTELKKLANIISKMKSELIQIRATPTTLQFLTYHSRSQMYLIFAVDCKKVNRYYSAGEYFITLNAPNFCRIISCLSSSDKKTSSFESLAFIYGEIDSQSIFKLITKQRGGTISSDFIEPVNAQPFKEWNMILNDIGKIHDYNLSIRISMDLFKSIVTKAQKLSDEIRFEKIPGECLTYQYSFKAQLGSNVSIIKDGVDDNIINHNGDVLAVRVKLDRLKILTKLVLSNHIIIYMDNNDPMILGCDLGVFDIKMIIKENS